MAVAYCWRSGEIEIGSTKPEGSLLLVRGPRKAVETLICACARHAYDGVTLLVPGIPEAEDDEEALEAYAAFRRWIGQRPAALREDGAP